MIKTIDIDSIPADGRRTYRSRIKDIEEFIRSGSNACEVVKQKGDTAKLLWSSYYNAINSRQYYKDLVQVIQRQGRLFLIRVEDKRV